MLFFRAKKQVKENNIVVQKVTSELEGMCKYLNATWGRLSGISDEVVEHKKRIEAG